MGRPKGSKNRQPYNRAMRDPVERFLEKIEVSPNGCWVWKGQISSNGYGHFWWAGRMSTAHRFSYEFFREFIPDNLEPDHLCRNRSCVNPDHLELVTRSVNMKRGLLGGHRTHCKRGHPYSGDNLYVYPDGRRLCRACARITSQRGPEPIAVGNE